MVNQQALMVNLLLIMADRLVVMVDLVIIMLNRNFIMVNRASYHGAPRKYAYKALIGKGFSHCISNTDYIDNRGPYLPRDGKTA